MADQVAKRNYDVAMIVLIVALTCFGIVMVYSSSSIMAVKRYNGDSFYFLKRQLAYAVAGFALMAWLARTDYRALQRWAVPGLFLCLLLLLAVLVPGIGARAGGASRWLRLGPVSVQPAELAKVGLIIYMAYSLAKKREKIKNFAFGFLPYMVVVGVLLMLLVVQPDLGSSLTIASVAMAMLLIAGTRMTYLVSIILLSLPLVYYAIVHKAYRLKRIMVYLDPWQDPTGAGFQIIQSWIAIGSGGLFGHGLGEGKQKLFYLPEAHTDFIFSVIGEELGFIGVFVTAVLFLILVMRGIRTAQTAPDDFGRHLAFGVTFLIGMEAFFNMGVVLGLVPTKGLTLPFISYGGSSLLCTLAAAGILINISSQTRVAGGR